MLPQSNISCPFSIFPGTIISTPVVIDFKRTSVLLESIYSSLTTMTGCAASPVMSFLPGDSPAVFDASVLKIVPFFSASPENTLKPDRIISGANLSEA